MTSMGFQEPATGSIAVAKPRVDGGIAWVVRAGAQGEAEASNLALGRASIGWSDVPDMSSVTSRDQLREIVDGLYPAASAQSHAVTTGQLWAFRSSIAVGDLVVMPLKTQPGMIALGRCTGAYRYDANAPEVARHYLPVEWQPVLVSRETLQPDLLAMVNGAMTVFSVSRNDAAERLQAVADHGVDPGFGSGDGSQEPVRRWLLDRAALEVLSEESPTAAPYSLRSNAKTPCVQFSIVSTMVPSPSSSSGAGSGTATPSTTT